MALKIYIKARATPKVVAAFAERREFDKILIYSKQVQSLVLRNSHFQLLGRNCSLKCTGSLKPFDFFSGWIHTRLSLSPPNNPTYRSTGNQFKKILP
jgi:hypothetical protein